MKPQRIYTSSIYVNLDGGSQARSVDADHTYEFHVDPVSKRLVRDRKSADRKSLDRKAGKPDKAPEFITKPRRQFVDEGQTAKFKASYDGPHSTKLLWTFNGMVLSNDSKHKIYQDKDIHWLEVCDVTSEDAGQYTCTIQNATGSSQASAELDVHVKPKPVLKKGFVAPEVAIPLTDQILTPDQKSVVLECKFSNAIDANATWYKDGRKLNSGYFAKQTFDGRLARLTLNKVTEREMGTYECTVSNTGGEVKTQAQLSFRVAGSRSIPPKFALPLTNQTLAPGDQLTLESSVTGYPKPSIKWYRNNVEIHSSRTTKMEFDGSKVKLTIPNVQTSDSDSYKCVAENEAGQDQIKANVSVIAPSSATDDFKEPPVFVKELVDMEANDGDRVELVVKVEGTPPIEIVWVHKEREISFEDPVFKMKSDGNTHRLIIPEVLPEDTGEFVCEAYNDCGDTDTFCFLHVREIFTQPCMKYNTSSESSFPPATCESESERSLRSDSGYVTEKAQQKPDFILKPHTVEVKAGGTAIFLCRITGSPSPSIKWETNGKTINNDERHKITYGEECVLEIRNVTPEDSGLYTCTLTNPAGVISMDTRLVVNDSDLPSNPPNRLPTQHKTVQRIAVEKLEQKRSSMNTSSPVVSQHKEKQVQNSSFHGDSELKRLQKLRELEQKPQKSHEIHDFRGVLKSKVASSEKIDYKSVLKHKSNTDLSKIGEKKLSAGPELGTDFREVLSQRKKSREERVKTQNERKSNSFSGPPAKKDNSSSSIDYRSVLHRKRNSLPKEASPVMNKENSYSVIREKSPVIAKGGQETLTHIRTPTRSRLVDRKSPFVHNDTPINSASETKLKYDTPKMETNDNLIHHQKDRDRTAYKGDQDQLISPSQCRRRASPTMKQVSNQDLQPTDYVLSALPSQNVDIPQPQLLTENVQLGIPTQREDKQSHLPTENIQRGTLTEKVDKQPHQPTENVQRGTLTEKVDKQPHQPTENVQSGTPTEHVDTQPNHPSVLSDVIDEGTIEHLLAKRRQKRRQSPAHKDYIPPDSTSIVNIPVFEPVKTGNERPEGQNNTSLEPETTRVREDNGGRTRADHNKEEETSHSLKTDSGRSVGTDKIISHEKLKTSSDISPAVVNSQEEDFRTVLANRKNGNTNGLKDSPEDKTGNESSDILKDWRTRRHQRSQDKEGLNGDSESTVENVAQESTKPKEKTRPPLSKLNLNLTVKHSENSSQNGSVKTPENNSEDFRSILSRKKRSSSSFSKYDTKDNKVPSSPKTTDFRHVLTRHVSYVENRHRQAPQFTSLLRDKSVKEGESVTMECHVTGVPRPEIMWMMNNNQIKPSKFFRMTYDDDHIARLVIAGAYPEDDGVYVCTASNSSGSETSSCHLFVKELVSTTDQSEEEGGMKKEETTEDDSTCTEDEFADTLEAPVIHEINPAQISTTPGQKITIQVSFTSDEKPSIEWRKGGLLLKTDDTVSISTTEHFSRLTVPQVKVTDAGNYEISVKNSIGQATAMSTVNVHDVPGQVPGRPYASDTSLRSVILSWGCPSSDGGSPVTGYRVEMCEAETEVWQTLTEQCHSTSYHVADLLPHTPYFFRVTAKNKHGFGNPSETSSVVVTKDRRSSLRLSVDSDDVFVMSPTSPTGSSMSIFSPTEEDLPFEPKMVALQQDRKFEENYDLQEAIGKGKFGKVHKCLEKTSGKTFAAKIVKCRTQKEKENLKQEVEIMNLLSHPKLLMLWDAFETARSVVLVMEYVAGGELFDRVADEDLELTESDCVHFMRQICQGLQYMHLRSILHLDLKPENILCINKDNNLIKIIDFGLARRHLEGDSLRVMFGTPEFIAPEVVNYEEIGFPTDIWSVGVICYVLLSGLSPFMGDSDVETLSNVTRGDYDFDDEAFDEISDLAKDFINKTIKLNKKKRLTIDQCLEHPWLARSERNSSKKLRQSLRNLKQFMARRKWQKMGNAIRAVGRISMLQKSRSGSESSVQSDSDVSSQTDNSTFSSSRPSSIGSEGKSDLRQIKPSNNLVLNPPNPCANPSHITNPDRTEGLPKQGRDPQLAFLKEMVDCEAFVGDNARFDVRINGNKTMPPSVQWYHEGETIQSEGKYSVMDALSDNGEYSLIIKNVDGSNEGEYTCKATSGGHEITCSADLILNDAGAI